MPTLHPSDRNHDTVEATEAHEDREPPGDGGLLLLGHCTPKPNYSTTIINPIPIVPIPIIIVPIHSNVTG
jgi:hypothetical protein